ncbi:MAG: hypothetical protein A2275_17715 [Bacteroidetes bacterium RIFOXYA12_FULL_35_11]|nr:MAG: hypothetical protein A2X01_14660 [Bacteroidetes bacterium GWF2_35_48]OFY80577.1 MAG: hypothetical protein A2275_17715 [Bacteroidetes bacterium RIFOXYA12_FULL_35_11]HBX50046.1 hypothetical protein [Bacteroidales bacterium]
MKTKDKKQKGKQKIEKLKPNTEPIIFPTHKNFFFYIFLCISFLSSFIFYLLTLAPTVTLEDSGELIAAAYSLGVPHEPGYPLFVVFGKLFSLLPLGDIAYRLNLMSAFFTSLAGVFLFYSMVLIIENTFIKTDFWKKFSEQKIKILNYIIAFSAASFFTLAFETWEQSIITEVYGIYNFTIAIALFLFLKWLRIEDINHRKKSFLLLCFAIGISFTSHNTAGLLIPVLGGFMLIYERKTLLDFKFMGKAIAFFILGLTPWLLLPVFSSFTPAVDWGNPENITNFFRVVTRHQYQFQETESQGMGTVFTFFFKDILPDQWYPVFLILIPVGIYILYKQNKHFFWFSIFFLIMAVPVMSYLTRDYLNNEENRTLVSIAYIPAYLMLSLLMATGLFYSITRIKTAYKGLIVIAVLISASTFSNTIKNYGRLTMKDYFFAQQYAENIFNNLPKNTLFMVNWDPFAFPMNYYQFVEKKRTDLLVIDQMLLKRSWYIQWLKENYPDYMKQIEAPVEGFLIAVAPFENGDNYDGNLIQKNYISMINAFIDATFKNNHSVYFAYIPEKEILRNYRLEPQYAAYKYVNTTVLDSTINDASINLSYFLNHNINRDRMANYMSDYYGDLYGMRGTMLEQEGKKETALEHYLKAALLLDKKSKKYLYTHERIRALKDGKL